MMKGAAMEDDVLDGETLGSGLVELMQLLVIFSGCSELGRWLPGGREVDCDGVGRGGREDKTDGAKNDGDEFED